MFDAFLQATCNLHPDGIFRESQPDCDLGIGKALQCGQRDNFPAARGQTVNGLDDQVEALVKIGGFGSVGTFIQDAPIPYFGYRDVGINLIAAKEGQRGIARHGKKNRL